VAIGSERETQQGKVHHSVIGASKVSLESGVVQRHPHFSTARPYGNGGLGGVGLMTLRCVFVHSGANAHESDVGMPVSALTM